MDLQIDYRIAPQIVVVAFVASKCDRTKGVALEEKKIAKCGVTDANSILQHGLKYRLKLARRRTNYTQHLRGRRLLLQRFGKLACAVARPRTAARSRSQSRLDQQTWRPAL